MNAKADGFGGLARQDAVRSETRRSCGLLTWLCAGYAARESSALTSCRRVRRISITIAGRNASCLANSPFINSLFETCVEQPQGDLLRAVVDNLTGFDGSHALALFFVGVDL